MYTKFCSIPAANVASCPSVGWGKDFSDGQTISTRSSTATTSSSRPTTTTPSWTSRRSTRRWHAAKLLTDPKERAAAWGEIDAGHRAGARRPVELWDKWPNIRSANVNGVVNLWNDSWDLTFTSIK